MNQKLRLTPAALNADTLENFMAAATPGGIEAQEARGQRDFVASTTLPKQCNGCTREQLEAMGIVFGKDEDDLFIAATLPAGWKKEATDHSMWSKLIDDKDRERASIFYKAAFYDRSAHIDLSNFYRTRNRYLDTNGKEGAGRPSTIQHLVVNANGETLLDAGTAGYEDYAAQETCDKKCVEWLASNAPDWRNPLAYWD